MDAEEQLWRDWEDWFVATGRDPTKMCRDGIVDSELFQWPRIAFVLKETNDLSHDLREYIRDCINSGRFNDRDRTFPTLETWAAAAIETLDSSLDVKSTKALCHTAVMNLKKLSGGATASPAEIGYHAGLDRTLLLRQIDIISPDVVIACGEAVPDLLCNILSLHRDQCLQIRDHQFTKTSRFGIVAWRHPNRASADAGEQLRALCLRYQQGIPVP